MNNNKKELINESENCFVKIRKKKIVRSFLCVDTMLLRSDLFAATTTAICTTIAAATSTATNISTKTKTSTCASASFATTLSSSATSRLWWTLSGNDILEPMIKLVVTEKCWNVNLYFITYEQLNCTNQNQNECDFWIGHFKLLTILLLSLPNESIAVCWLLTAEQNHLYFIHFDNDLCYSLHFNCANANSIVSYLIPFTLMNRVQNIIK